jgi:predicted dehydrogenase
MAITGMQAWERPRRLRLGMVGGGRGALIGAVHRLAARLDDHYELVAGAFSADPETARASARELGVADTRTYADFRQMATVEAGRDDGIDVVAIVTPNHLHHAVACAFLDAGIDVICDKPLCTSLADARDLEDRVARSRRVFVLTHNYAGYPLVREARARVQAGELGTIRVVQVEYAQDWLAARLEASGQKQASWRTDPARAGPGGCLGDIGTHAHHLAGFVTGLEVEELCASLSTFVEGRPLDDDAQILLRYQGGTRGMLWASQVAAGNENGLRLRVYGAKAGLAFEQENPNRLLLTPLGEPPRVITRGGPSTGPAAAHASRIPAGHPEGFLEGFANLYADAAELIRARIEGRAPDPAATLVPGVTDGVRGVAFIEAAVRSSRAGGTWVRPA